MDEYCSPEKTRRVKNVRQEKVEGRERYGFSSDGSAVTGEKKKGTHAPKNEVGGGLLGRNHVSGNREGFKIHRLGVPFWLREGQFSTFVRDPATVGQGFNATGVDENVEIRRLRLGERDRVRRPSPRERVTRSDSGQEGGDATGKDC